MKELIEEEEGLLSKKTEGELENRRVELQRGVRALREEIAKQDWDSAISKLCKFAKEKRIKKSLTVSCQSIKNQNAKNVWLTVKLISSNYYIWALSVQLSCSLSVSYL